MSTTGYSAHPDLAAEQLRNAENASRSAKNQSGITNNNSPQRRRHNSAGFDDRPNRGFFNFSPFRSKANAQKTITLSSNTNEVMSPTSIPQKTLPDRTQEQQLQQDSSSSIANSADDGGGGGDSGIGADVGYEVNKVCEALEKSNIEYTKDCVDCAPIAPPIADYDEQEDERFRRSHSEQPKTFNNCEQQTHVTLKNAQLNFSEGYMSGLSSAISSPSPSTVSSASSTPIRLTTQLHHSHQNCCRKSSKLAKLSTSSTSPYQHHHLHEHSHQHQHHHHHHHHHHHNHNHNVSSSSSSSLSSASAVAGGCKKLQKFDPRFGPSPYRQLLPIILCILSFATVFTILIIYMDTTEIRHQQFRLNMSRDYDLYGVAQDDPTLIAFLRQIHMRKYPMHFLKNHDDPTTVSSTVSARGTLNFSAHHDGGLVPEMAHYVAQLVDGKVNGATIQSLTGAFGQLITAPWLAETLDWSGIIVEPEPRRYFTLRKQNAYRAHMQVVHACVSPNPYPKEVTIHNEESEVRINRLFDEETSWFNSRVKCFPLYTIMLACNRVEYDLLSLGVHGHELEILQTLPFEKIKIEIISIHLPDSLDKIPPGYVQTITKFLTGKGYKLQKTFGSNYFYQRINTTNRTRKKDILLLKTP